MGAIANTWIRWGSTHPRLHIKERGAVEVLVALLTDGVRLGLLQWEKERSSIMLKDQLL